MTRFDNYKPVRLIELFAGIGAQAKALENLGINFEHWRVCEFDEHAVRSYNAVHNTNFVPSDITKISADDLNIVSTGEYTYLLTYSFPCQDLSVAGNGRGMEKGGGTRSGLLWEVERLLNECTELPQVLLMENVPQVHGKKNIADFNKWIEFLESKGYSNYWKDLNAKDYGIPQSRNRCYMVSILGEYSYEFPGPVPLELKLGDMLEQDVDEKYYLSDKKIRTIHKWNSQERPLEKVYGKNSIARTLTTRSGAECGSLATFSEQFEETTDIVPLLENPVSELKRTSCNELLQKNLVEEYDVIRHSYTNNRLNNGVENMARTESKERLSPTLDTRCDCLGVVVPKVVGGVGEKKSNGGTQWYQQDRIYDDQLAISVTTSANPYYTTSTLSSLRIRKLTPKECWRLMGFSDEDFINAEKVCSNSKLYKQAGNSIVVDVLMAIFKELLIPQKSRSEWLDELLNF